MKPYLITIINALVLIVLAFWGFFISNYSAYTALIPLGIGLVLLLLSKGLKKEKKVESHVVVLLTLLIFVALFKPLIGAINRSDCGASSRVILMLVSSLVALIYYIRSFILARKKK